LASQIRQALDTSSVAGDSRSINVSVQNGDVTLTGTIPSDSERHQVDDLVRNTSGVSAVYDQMQTAPVAGITQTYSPAYSSSVQPVAPTGRPEASGYANTMVTGDIFNLHVQGLNETDRTMAERILHGLRTDTTLNSLLPVVNITVMNGRIVLQGAVQNEQQRRTIASVIERAAGAANVENDLQVVGP
jgi:osmotically-inducible protein OsmY